MALATLGTGRSVNFTRTVPPPLPPEEKESEEELPLPVMAMRWIPGGLSIAIFVAFTIAASAKVYMDKDEPAKKTAEESGDPGEEIAEVDFFKMDVISKLKPGKKNIFQRRLLQNKQKKFSVYEKMMRQYKDDVIARRAQDARHAEIQKEKEEKERQKEAEIAEQKKRAIEEHKRNTLRRKQEKLRMQQLEGIESGVSGAEDDGGSVGTLTPSVSFSRAQASGDSDNATGTASDRSVSPNDSGSALAARNTDTSRNSSPTHSKNLAAPSEDSQDNGIMLKMKSKDGNEVAETSFMTDSSEESQAQKQESLNVPRLNFQSTEESDDSTDHHRPSDEESTALLPENKDDEISYAMNQPRVEVHPPEGEEREEARDIITPLRSRPFTWSEADFDQKLEEEAYQRFSSTSSYEDDENTQKMNAMIERFAQNARESRGLVEPEEGEGSTGASAGKKKGKKKNRPRTWSYGATYGEEGKTDSITELMATIMDLGPQPLSPLPEGSRRRSRPLVYDAEDEEKLLAEIERRMIESVHEDEMAGGDLLVLEKLMSDVSDFYKEY